MVGYIPASEEMILA